MSASYRGRDGFILRTAEALERAIEDPEIRRARRVRRVLLVDEVAQTHPLVRNCLEEIQDYGFLLHSATTPGQGLKRLQSSRYDLVLVDSHLEGATADGLELLAEAFTLWPSARYVLLTAYTSLEWDPHALAARGVDALVNKPWSRVRLQQLIRVLLDTPEELLDRFRLNGCFVIPPDMDEATRFHKERPF